MSFFSRAQYLFGSGGNNNQGGGGDGDPPAGRNAKGMPPSRAQKIARVTFLLLAIGIFLSSTLFNFYTDILWFNNVGFSQVFWGILGTKIVHATIWFLIALTVIGVNLWIPKRFKPAYNFAASDSVAEQYRQSLSKPWRWIIVAVGGAVGLLSAAAAVPAWETFILWLNQQPFNKPDPHFGIDIGFFVFSLPFSHLVAANLFSLLVISVIGAGAAHGIFGGIRVQGRQWMITKTANAHLSILVSLLIIIQVWKFWLYRFDLSFSERGNVIGLSYTDVHAELRAYELLIGIGLLCAFVFVYTAFKGGWILPAASVSVLFAASILLSGVYPEVVQRLQVAPQELPRERPYIKRNLDMTRWAFNISQDHVSYEPFEADSNLTRKQAVDNSSILNSIRVWDPHTLRNTYKQLQELRPYYDFSDVDVSRFVIDDQLQQVMLSVREIQTNSLNEPTWQNKTTMYTHGYGMVASTVSTAAGDGQPVFLSRDIPNRGAQLFDLKQPRIYYGESSPEYSIVGTQGDEFDYETETAQEYTRYEGLGGVNVGSLFNRLAFAVKFRELNILLSSLIQPESKILYYRDIRDRVELVAPFLQLESDAYPAVVDGRVKWIQDAYTVSNQIPYAQRIDLTTTTAVREKGIIPQIDAAGKQVNVERIVDRRNLTGQANYVRNSVKAIVDAYDGTVQLIITDPTDPIIMAWKSAFPDIFVDNANTTDELKNQFRHPEGLFRVQSELLLSYHIQDPDAFYNRSDKWQLPPDRAFAANNKGEKGSVRTFPPSYQLVKLPGEDKEDFSLIQPFSPADREVLSAYMAASGDPENLGKIRIFTMPPTETVFGPSQVFARINQDPEVSQLITLLSDKQSSIIYGNLIVVPIEQSLLYALPLFLKSEQSEIPELRRVVLVYGDKVIMEDRLSQALQKLFGTIPTLAIDGVPAEDAPAKDDEDSQFNTGKGLELDAAGRALVAKAILNAVKAQEALKAGKLGDYQDYNAKSTKALTTLQRTYNVEVKGLPKPTDDKDVSKGAADKDTASSGSGSSGSSGSGSSDKASGSSGDAAKTPVEDDEDVPTT